MNHFSFLKYYYAQFILGLAVFLFLTGCGSTAVQVNAQDTNTPLSPQKGYVIAKVLRSHSYDRPMNRMIFTYVDPKSKKEEKGLWLKKIGDYEYDKDLARLGIFYGELPEGNYYLHSMQHSYYHNDGINIASASKYITGNSQIGSFEVKRGQVTDLGSLLYADFKKDGKWREGIARLKDFDEHIYDNFVPNHDTLGTPIDSWDIDVDAQLPFFLRNTLIQSQWQYRSIYYSESSGLFVGLNLGMFAHRALDNQWKLTNLDTNFAITKFSESQSGRLAVAASYGGIFIKNTLDEWNQVLIPKGYSKVDSLRFDDQNDLRAIFSSSKGSGLFVLKLNGDNKNWVKNYEFTANKGWSDSDGNNIKTEGFTPYRKARSLWSTHYVEETKNLYVKVDDPGFNSYHSNFSFDLNEIEKDVVTSKELSRFRGLPTFSGSRIYQREHNGWGTAMDHHYDKGKGDIVRINNKFRNCIEGKNCSGTNTNSKGEERLEEFEFYNAPFFTSRDTALAFISPDNNKEQVLVVTTRDSGKTWKKLEAKAPGKNCRLVSSDGVDELSVICEESLHIHTTKDFGKTWESEYIGVDRLSKYH